MTNQNQQLDLLYEYLNDWIDEQIYQVMWWEILNRTGIPLSAESLGCPNSFEIWKLIKYKV